MSDNSQTVFLKNFYKGITQETTLMFGHQFTVEFFGPELPPPLRDNQVDGTNFTYYVKSSSVPKVEIDQAEVAFLSQKFVVPKQVKFRRFLENKNSFRQRHNTMETFIWLARIICKFKT